MAKGRASRSTRGGSTHTPRRGATAFDPLYGLLNPSDVEAYFAHTTPPLDAYVDNLEPVRTDARRWTPFEKGARYARASLQPSSSKHWNRVQYADSLHTLVCVRRGVRREVLHALKKTGRGGGRHRLPHWHWHSHIDC